MCFLFRFLAGLNLTEVIRVLPLFLYWWVLLKICELSAPVSILFFSRSSILSYLSISLSFLYPFLRFSQPIPLNILFFSFRTFLHASRSFRLCSTPHRISFSSFHKFLFLFIPLHIFCIFFPSFFLCFCSFSVSFFFLVEIMHSHIPYYLHL